MILCSKLVFLNVVTQLMKAEDLLNANYFIVDRTLSTGKYADIASDAPHLNQFGELVYGDDELPPLDFSSPNNDRCALNPYHIKYSHVFDTAQYYSIKTNVAESDFKTPEQQLVEHLQLTETQKGVYQTLFQSQLQGNGVQILIMVDDYGCQMFGGIIASFLSEMFGADVTFVDAMYRKNTHGQVNYVGNKEYAKTFIPQLRDHIMLQAIQQAVDTAAFGSCMNNLEQLFNNDALTIQDLFHAYELLFPNDPLRPGEYTMDHIKRIIIGRIMDATGKTGEQKQLEDMGLENIGMGMYSFQNLLKEYGVEDLTEEDFSGIM